MIMTRCPYGLKSIIGYNNPSWTGKHDSPTSKPTKHKTWNIDESRIGVNMSGQNWLMLHSSSPIPLPYWTLVEFVFQDIWSSSQGDVPMPPGLQSYGTETDTRASMAIGSNINSFTTSGDGESRPETCLWSHVFLLFINPLWALYGQNVQPINCNSTHNWQILVCLWVTHLEDDKLDSTSCCRSNLGAWMWTNFESSFYSR